MTWTDLGRFLALPPSLMQEAWQGLVRATGTRAVELRQLALLHEPYRGQTWHPDRAFFATHGLAPPRVVQALYVCVEEGTLARATAHALESLILDWTTAHGQWMTRAEHDAAINNQHG